MLREVLKSVTGFGRTAFGYDATSNDKKFRQPNPSTLKSEDDELRPQERKKLIGGSRDVHRNYTLVPWAIRQHLNYVSNFTPQIRTPNNELTWFLEDKLDRWSRAENFDVSRRHPLRRFIRMCEARRTIDGDVGIIRVADGRVQAIEGDRIRTPYGGLPLELGRSLDRLKHGVLVDAYDAALGYAVCRRVGGSDYLPGTGGFVFQQLVTADHLFLHAYWDRFDQVRGISPLASALNTFRDTNEGIEYALAKMKVAQLFGLVTKRAADTSLGDIEEEEEDDGSGNTKTKYDVDFGVGQFHLDLDPGDSAEFLENKTPSIEFQSFVTNMFALSLKSVDIPYSFFAENFSTYSGQRQALLGYNESAKQKRADNQDLLNWLTRWKFWLMWVNNELPGLTPEMFEQIHFEWIPAGLPWIDPLKEIQADIAAIESGLTSPQRVCRERGEDWYEIQDERAEANQYLKTLGIDAKSNPIPVTINEVSNA